MDSNKKKDKRKRRKAPVLDLNCPICEAGIEHVDYKDVFRLKKYTSVRGKIIGRTKTGFCARHQRELTRAVKIARKMALLPYVNTGAKKINR